MVLKLLKIFLVSCK
ncbi:UNVERIFIED_CONTAM: hypothetical protein GTU68_034568 [Idotea baltica]|nr:hypothetical protein [Idotea baltica]